MKKIGRVLLAFVLLFICCVHFGTSFAEEKINSIDIEMEIQNDGSAKIKQTWDIETDFGTEFYIPMTNMGDMEIQDFRVTDENGKTFTFVENWDTNASLDEKAYKNGFNFTDEGFELCWGKGSYGKHTYTLEYTMTNLVKSYPDYDGFLTRLVNDGMNPAVQSASVKITRADVEDSESFTTEDVGIWAFGYKGSISKEKGYIFAMPSGELDYDNHITILVRLPKGLIQPVSLGDGTFKNLEEQAKFGSDYENLNGDNLEVYDDDYSDSGLISDGLFGVSSNSFFGEIAIFFFIATLFLIFYLLRNIGDSLENQYINLNRDSSTIDYYRKVPMNGSIPCITFSLKLSNQTVSEKNILSAYMIYLVKNEALKSGEINSRIDEKSSYFDIYFGEEMEERFAKSLFELVNNVSQLDNNLQKKNLKEWIKNHNEEIECWLKNFKSRGEKEFRSRGGIEVDYSKNRQKELLTEKGVQLINQAVGFKNFIKDFNSFSESEINEVKLWDEYLIFSALFDTTDQFAEEIEKLQPNFAIESNFYYGILNYHNILHLSNMMNKCYKEVDMGNSYFNDSGGLSSMGGGGGFFGGGTGGGSR